ncbi:hypothetical protein E3J85_01190, partial [Patescibacteria group bacterium]
PNKLPANLISHGAKTCYDGKEPKWGKRIDIKKRLYDVGHATPLQSVFYTFHVGGISVGNISFGFHLVHQFLSSCQRSGRYCIDMFRDPRAVKRILRYINYFWPEISERKQQRIQRYVEGCIGLFRSHIDEATAISEEYIRKDRPRASDKYIRANAKRFAQEQLRVVIPIVFPTAFDHTLNLSTLIALHQVAWDEPMKYVVGRMARLVLKHDPTLRFAFSKKSENDGLDFLNPNELTGAFIQYQPKLKLIAVDGIGKIVIPTGDQLHPVDRLHFEPDLMENSIHHIKTRVEMSLIDWGQDQRHRMVLRGQPEFTGGIYCPPIVRALGLEKELEEFGNQWIEISQWIPQNLARVLTLYGAVVVFEKSGSFNAVIHEQGKRTCFCAQSSIWELARKLRLALIPRFEAAGRPELGDLFAPACYTTEQCGEGMRYCGRDMGEDIFSSSRRV